MRLLQHLDQWPGVLAECDGVGVLGRIIIQSRAARDIGLDGLFFSDGKVRGSHSRKHVAWLQDALRRNWLAHDAQQSIADRAGHQ